MCVVRAGGLACGVYSVLCVVGGCVTSQSRDSHTTSRVSHMRLYNTSVELSGEVGLLLKSPNFRRRIT